MRGGWRGGRGRGGGGGNFNRDGGGYYGGMYFLGKCSGIGDLSSL